MISSSLTLTNEDNSSDEEPAAQPIVCMSPRTLSLKKDICNSNSEKGRESIEVDGVESGNANEANSYRAASKKTGIRVHGLVNGGHWSVRLSDPNPEVRIKGRKNLENAIVNSHLLGGSSVLLVPGKVGGVNETHDHVWDRSIKEVRAVIPLAAKLGIRVLIESLELSLRDSN